jgi:hypothetical protein
LRAAQSLVRPQLNFISSYNVNGFGNNLFDIKGVNAPGPGNVNLQSFYQTLSAGNQTGFTLGFQFNMPLGFRQALSQVRNYELRLAKAKEALAQAELEICHELTTTFQNMAWRYQTAQTNYNRWQISERQVPGREERFKTGVPGPSGTGGQPSGIDTSVLLQQWLQQRTQAATAEVAFYTSVVEYQKAITDLHYRKGTLLELNDVHLAEGTWTADAYQDALRRAWARSFAIDAVDADPVHQAPEAFERQGDLGSVQFVSPAMPQRPVGESGEPTDLHSKSGALQFPTPATPAVPPEGPLPDELPE